jgi:hypothetical protein
VQERSSARIAGFHEKVDVCGLYELSYEGRKWTFEKKVAGGVLCHVRLDRALATADWHWRFPLARVTYLAAAAWIMIPSFLVGSRGSERGGKIKGRCSGTRGDVEVS